jgi:hypothetical protein
MGGIKYDVPTVYVMITGERVAAKGVAINIDNNCLVGK